MKVNYLGTQYTHKFSSGVDIKYITCSNDEFSLITQKPTLEGYEYLYTVGDMLKVDSETGLLEEGQYTEVDGQTVTRNWEDNGQPMRE